MAIGPRRRRSVSAAAHYLERAGRSANMVVSSWRRAARSRRVPAGRISHTAPPGIVRTMETGKGKRETAAPKGTFEIVGPHARPLLAALVSDDELRRIEDGTLLWSIERESLSAVGGDLDVIERDIAEKAEAKRYVLELRRAGGRPGRRDDVERLAPVEHEQGARLVRAREFDAAVAKRSGVASEIFAEGKPDDWTGVESEPTWDGYQWEFAQAAQRLVESGAEGFPKLAFLFLCRQQLELLLKSIIVRGRLLLDLTAPFPKTHSLQELWALALPIMKATWPDDPAWSDEQAKRTKAVVDEFHELDPSSDFFRYPVDGRGDPVKYGSQLHNFSPSGALKSFERGTEMLQGSRTWIEFEIYMKERPAPERTTPPAG